MRAVSLIQGAGRIVTQVEGLRHGILGAAFLHPYNSFLKNSGNANAAL
jgi:hypothetical protein